MKTETIMVFGDKVIGNKGFVNKRTGSEIKDIYIDSASHTPAHESAATVASFRIWLGLRLIIARGPAESVHYNQ